MLPLVTYKLDFSKNVRTREYLEKNPDYTFTDSGK